MTFAFMHASRGDDGPGVWSEGAAVLCRCVFDSDINNTTVTHLHEEKEKKKSHTAASAFEAEPK